MARHFAISDIHGCFDSLVALIDYIRPSKDDVVITLGDYVDRGPRTAEVIDWLIEFDRTHNLQPLRGNHDMVMCNAKNDRDAFDYWYNFGGDKVLASYAPGMLPNAGSSLDDIPEAHWDFLEHRLLRYYEIDSHFFVHANVDPDLKLREQSDSTLFWEKFVDPPAHRSGKYMVCGHTSQKTGLPIANKHAICLDSRVYDTGWLTCMHVETGEIYQANATGSTRKMSLNDVTSSSVP